VTAVMVLELQLKVKFFWLFEVKFKLS